MEINYTYNLEKYNVKIPITAASHISQDIFNKVLEAKKFNDWILIIRGIKILDMYMFSKTVGFVGLVLDSSLKSHPEKKLPGYVCLRGHAVTPSRKT